MLFGQSVKVGVVLCVDGRATQVVVPVGTGLHVDLFAVNHRDRFGGRLVRSFLGVEQILVVVRPRFVVVVHAGHMGIVKNVGNDLGFARRLDVEPSVSVRLPATLVLVLIFPFRGIARARLRLHVVPPHVFGAFAIRPHVLAGHAARVAANAFVQMENHRYLRADIHGLVSMLCLSDE